jgi:ABC-2 type transport system permease protein
MNRMIRAIIGAGLILAIAFSAISISQNIGKRWKVDITDRNLYTLSAGTKAILGKLNQPIKFKLYYSKTAALKGTDQIRYFNNYYEFVRSLLEEYEAVSKGMVKLEVIDPRPFSDEESEALRYNLTRYQITQEESFFFGLVVQTEFGVEKAIPFFTPDRQDLIEYDISYLIDTATTREKGKIGIISSLPVMGDDVSGYMAEMMRRQNQKPRPAWTVVELLRRKYEVETVATDVNDINNVDILLVIHPKGLPEQTLFAIDQFVLKGGRTIICVDPYCMSDQPPQMQMQMQMQHDHSSNLNALMRTWGLEMPSDTFAGDKNTLAPPERLTRNARSEDIIGYLDLMTDRVPGDTLTGCFSPDHAITAKLNLVQVLFAGVLNNVDEPNEAEESKSEITKTPLIMTTNEGNSFSVSNQYELMMVPELMRKFIPGNKPVTMGYLITGRLKSSFPEGIKVESESPDPNDPNETVTTTRHVAGLSEAQENCAVVVFSDVDFISDRLVIEPWFFGARLFGDNSTLLLNTIDVLSGSSDLVSIRSRGSFKRPFIVVNEIRKVAEAETAEEVERFNQQIADLKKQRETLSSTTQESQDEVIGSSNIQEQQKIDLKIHEAQRQLIKVQRKRRERIEILGNRLRNVNMLLTPMVILAIAVALGAYRSVRKRHYISHASDA